MITVLIPMHSDSPYIEFTLDSILQQKLSTKFEVVLVFDRVPAHRKNYVKKYLNNFPTKFFDSTQPGLVSALNLGIMNTKNKYIARIDSDDLMIENRLQSQLNFMEDNRNVSVLGSQVEYIDEFNRVIGISNYPTSYRNIKQELPWNCCLAHPSVMLRTEALLKFGGYSNKYMHAEDYELWLRMFKSTEIRNLTEVLTRYRISSTQVSKINRLEQIYSTALIQKSFHLITNNNTEFLNNRKKVSKFGNNLVLSKIYFGFLSLKIDLRTCYLISKFKNQIITSLVYGVSLVLIHPLIAWFKIRRKFRSFGKWDKLFSGAKSNF
jgi:glycosyltransferase involved in cell wall biosynthesis